MYVVKHRIDTRGRVPTFVPLAPDRVPLRKTAPDVVQFPYMASKFKPLSDQQVEEALAAIEHAQKVRRLHRRKSEPGSAARETDIKLAQERIREAMKPIRSSLSAWHYGPQSSNFERYRDAAALLSKALQSERRKLHKMRKR